MSWIQSVMLGQIQHNRVTLFIFSSKGVAASSSGYAGHHQGLGVFFKIKYLPGNISRLTKLSDIMFKCLARSNIFPFRRTHFSCVEEVHMAELASTWWKKSSSRPILFTHYVQHVHDERRQALHTANSSNYSLSCLGTRHVGLASPVATDGQPLL